jgi:hypothetical protein
MRGLDMGENDDEGEQPTIEQINELTNQRGFQANQVNE